MTLRSRVHQALEGHGLSGNIVRWFLATLIVVNIVVICLETMSEARNAYADEFAIFETVALVIFSIEYLLRFWSAAEHAHFQGIAGRLRWMMTPGALVDFLAIAPSLLVHDLRLVRVVRLARLMRVAKLGRYSMALRTLRHVMRVRMPDLLSLSFVLLIMLLLSSALMYHLEHDAQPTKFSSIPATMWWGIITLTTIGYGDMASITTEGRLLGSVVAILGIGMFALPAGLLGGAFVDELGRARRKAREDRATDGGTARTHCPHCHKPLSTD